MKSYLSFAEVQIGKQLHLRPEYRMTGDDLMVRGKQVYAVYDPDTHFWITDEAQQMSFVDDQLEACLRERYTTTGNGVYYANDARIYPDKIDNSLSGEIHRYNVWTRELPKERNYHQLDAKVTFADEAVTLKDYRSKRLTYSPKEGPTPYYDTIMGTCYDEENREKLEWAVGCVLCGDSSKVQKFIALYGKPGTGKSTFLNIVQMLLDGYWEIIDVDGLVSKNNQFATALLKSNPLVYIQHDADMSRIEKNDVFNSLVSHEKTVINEKNVKQYTIKPIGMIFLGTNEFINVADTRQGIGRRMIDVYPTGATVPIDVYDDAMRGIEFELPAIAKRCMDVYQRTQAEDRDKYLKYKPSTMIKKTNLYYNFVLDNFYLLSDPINDPITVGELYKMFKTYVTDAGYSYVPVMSKFRENVAEFYKELLERGRVPDGRQVRNLLKGFKADYVEALSDGAVHFAKHTSTDAVIPQTLDHKFKLVECTGENVLDKLLANCPAQYSGAEGIPKKEWAKCTTYLKDLRTAREHYVLLNDADGNPLLGRWLICVDFDLKGADGEKSLEKNLEAAETWPLTYCETSKSGKGLHLHYWYDGDANKLSRIFAEGIEIKVFTGKSALRRKLKLCNAEEIATINSGLPLREVKKTVDFKAVASEKQLRAFILRNLEKEYHGYTKPSIDFIKKGLDDAYESGLHYDVSDMQNAVLAFANNSSNNAAYCLKVVSKMKWKSEEPSVYVESVDPHGFTYFDIEVFPNVLIVCYKHNGKIHRMFNPSISAVEQLLKMKLVGYNNRKYDNHILYARMMGYGNEELYKLSKRLVDKDQQVALKAGFAEAYNLSEADVYDILATKKSLKRWEIELGIHHLENNHPWDEPLPEEFWEEVADYCCNDVEATEAVMNKNIGDLYAREILAELSGLSINHTTRQHASKIIFGDDKNPELVYTDLSKEFPGYKFVKNGYLDPSEFDGYDPLDKKTWKVKEHSVYLGKAPSEGGYVAYKEGIWYNCWLLDIESLHPHTIKALNVFGRYTAKFVEILEARLAIKHNDIEKAKNMLDGKLAKYLDTAENIARLAYALKIVINSIYGYTSATFSNQFKDPRNVDNIVAKRGALFMILLTHELDKKGIPWVHVKTDSIKIPNCNEEIANWICEFGKKYGYTFDHEATYREMCLINGSTYVAKVESGKHAGEWVCVAAQFQHPYVKKTLFTHEPIEFEDFCEVKEVKTAMSLDLNEGLPEDEHKLQFIGRIGNFIPVKPGYGGGVLLRDKAEQYQKELATYSKRVAEGVTNLKEPERWTSVTGTKGYRWIDAEVLKNKPFEEVKEMIDLDYYRKLCDEAMDAIDKYGDAEQFIAYGNRDAAELAEEEFPLDDDALPF